jgi:hypothetical protein
MFELVYYAEQLSMRKYLDRDMTQKGCAVKLSQGHGAPAQSKLLPG